MLILASPLRMGASLRPVAVLALDVAELSHIRVDRQRVVPVVGILRIVQDVFDEALVIHGFVDTAISHIRVVAHRVAGEAAL